MKFCSINAIHAKRNGDNVRLLLCITILILSGCIAGGGNPEKYGGEQLQKIGIPNDQIQLITSRKYVDKDILVNIMRTTKQNDVVFLVLANPGLPKNLQIQYFKETGNDYARSGLATNPMIDKEVIEMIMKDESHTVYSKLGWNDSVNEDQLRMLKATRTSNLVDFAYNINCPPEIIAEINNSNDDLAKQWLIIRKERKGK